MSGEMEKLVESLMAAVSTPKETIKAKKVDWSTIDTSIKHEGKNIVLPATPAPMTDEDAIVVLKAHIESEKQKYDVVEMVQGAPWDALVAISKALQQIYGVVIAQSTKTFFGEIKPDLITIQTGPNPEDNIQVAAGQMSLPNVESPVHISLHPMGAYITGTVRRRDRDILVDIAILARHIMSTDSIYKAKAIKLSVDNDGDLQLSVQPDFIKLAGVKETDMIHTADTAGMIDTNIFSPLKHTAACRLHHIPLKRGILLEGRYGTGKSLTARVTAKVAIDNGWTFIMLDRAQGLGAAIKFAKNYQPCVIFAEDIDRAADREDESVNDLVNMLDGLITKDMEMMVVLTTNFIDKIDKSLLRPGRFDAVISIQPPDTETAIRLIYQYGRDLIDNDMDLTQVGEVISGQIPATIREVVERAKLSMLMESRTHLTAQDLYYSAIGMKNHMALLQEKPVEDSAEKRFCGALTELILSATNVDTKLVDNITGDVGLIKRNQRNLAKLVTEKLDETNGFARAAAGSADAVKDVAEETLAFAKADLKTTEKVLKTVSN